MISRLLSVAVATIVLAGCESALVREQPIQATPVADAPKAAKKQPAPASSPLLSDMVYGVLAADIASQRGDYAEAHRQYLYAARIGRNDDLAELATKAALAANDKPAARIGVDYWLELQPNNAGALQIAALLAAEVDDRTLAASYLTRSIDVIRAAGGEGFIAVARLLSKITRPELRVDLMRRLTRGWEDDAEAMFALALVETGSGNHSRAEAAVRRALALRPDWDQPRLLLIRSLGAQKRHDEARSVLEGFLEDAPDDQRLRATYARLLVDQSEYEAAKAQFMRLLKNQPDDADTLFALGILTLQLDQLEEAERYLRRLYEVGSHRNEAAYYLGQILEETGEKKQAMDWYGRVEGAHRLDARVRIARIHGARGNIDRAREMVRQLRGSDGVDDARLYLLEAELLSDLKRYEDAIEVMDLALADDPDNNDLLYTRALAAANLNRVDVLERDLNNILSRDPNHADALNALGYTLADQTDRHQEALAFIQRALELKPDSPAVLDSMGWVQYRLGNRQEALRYLWRALETLPDAEIAAHLTEVLWEEGERERALKVWREAMEKDPESEFLQRVRQRYDLSR